MSRRRSIDRRTSRQMFSRTADHVHRKNLYVVGPMRGGIRL